eukprot:6661498-Prymnesium_polylepis.1
MSGPGRRIESRMCPKEMTIPKVVKLRKSNQLQPAGGSSPNDCSADRPSADPASPCESGDGNDCTKLKRVPQNMSTINPAMRSGKWDALTGSIQGSSTNGVP